MKVLHGLIGFALSLAALALGWELVAGVVGLPDTYGHTVRAVLRDSPSWRFALGASFIFLAVLFWLSALPLVRREQFLSFPGEGGAISISVHAINAFLLKLKGEFAGIVALAADVSASHRGAIEVRLEMKVKAGTHIQQLSQALQQRVRDSMRESLGIEDVAEVRVNVTDIVAVDHEPEPRTPPRADWQENG